MFRNFVQYAVDEEHTLVKIYPYITIIFIIILLVEFCKGAKENYFQLNLSIFVFSPTARIRNQRYFRIKTH